MTREGRLRNQGMASRFDWRRRRAMQILNRKNSKRSIRVILSQKGYGCIYIYTLIHIPIYIYIYIALHIIMINTLN